MRIARNYMIELELVEKLATIEGSASELINNLLSDYFGLGEDVTTTIEGLDKRKEILIAKQELHDRAVEKQKYLENNDLPDVAKEWIVKLQKKPTIIITHDFLKAHKIPATQEMREKITKAWETINSLNPQTQPSIHE